MITTDSTILFLKKWIIKPLLWLVFITFFFLLTTILALHLPPVQNKLIEIVTKNISQKTGFKTNIEYINISWFDEIYLKGVTIYDTEDSLMIGLDKLTVDFNLSILYNNTNIHIDKISIQHPEINLLWHKKTQALNINDFIEQINKLTSTQDSSSTSSNLIVNTVDLQNGTFQYSNPLRRTIEEGFNYNQFTVKDINGEIQNLRVAADTFEINVSHLTAIDQKTKLQVKSLKTFFQISNTHMLFDNVSLNTKNSYIADSIHFALKSHADFQDFNNNVFISANLDSTIISSDELALFAPELKDYHTSYQISGIFNGRVNRFSMRNLTLAFGQNSKLNGFVSISGLPEINESFIELQLNKSTILTNDLSPYMDQKTYEDIKKFGTIDMNGQFIGFLQDFVANGTFYTSLGFIETDLNFKIKQENAFYKGEIATNDFELGTFLEQDSLIGKISLNGQLEGSGLKQKQADFTLNANIEKFELNQYSYQKIQTNAHFAHEVFEGFLKINDPNLKFSANANINLRENKKELRITAQLDTLRLKPLNFLSKDVFVRSNIQIDTKGLQLDSIIGSAHLDSIIIGLEGRELSISYLDMISEKNASSRNFKIMTDRIEANVRGNYDFTPLFTDIAVLIKEYRLILNNNQAQLKKYYESKTSEKETQRKYNLEYSFKLKDINPLVRLFTSDTYIGPNTSLEGSFINGYTSIFSLNSHIDTLNYKSNSFNQLEIDINTSKISDSTNVLAMLYIAGNQQQFGSSIKTKDLLLEAIWSQDHIDFTTSIKQQDFENSLLVDGEFDFFTDKEELRFNTLDIKILENDWKIASKNKVVFDDNVIVFDSLSIKNNEQKIILNGVLSDSIDNALAVTVKQFHLNNFNPLLDAEVDGNANGEVFIHGFSKNMFVESELYIDQFTIEETLIGDIVGKAKWINEKERVAINYQLLDNYKKKIFHIEGTYTPADSVNSLNLDVNFSQARLEILELFWGEYISEVEGTAQGNLKVTGHVSAPILNGNGYINEGKLRVNYLNTKYSFAGELFLGQNEIGVRKLNLTDINNNTAEIKGGLFHDQFRNFVVSLEANLKNFMILNTDETWEDEGFYGTAITTGNLEILGVTTNLEISASATTNKGTKIYIPVNESSSISKTDYITFINPSDTVALVEKKVDLNNIQLNFEIDVTTDAYCEIIFDKKTNDIIKGRGEGTISLEINTQGEFAMFGNFKNIEGKYNFKIPGLVSKEFIIEPENSTIQWSGDPYAALMDIEASYQQMISLASLIQTPPDSAIYSAPEIKRRYPVKVVLRLKGDLMSPQIDFDIIIKEYPSTILYANGQSYSLETDIIAFKSRIKSDQQERQRQAFSLILFKSFAESNRAIAASGSLLSFSEVFSNQLSYWASQIDENLEIDVNIADLDFRFSYNFLEGRLRVTRNGGFATGQDENNVLSSIGEWTVEYLLTEDGRFRIKMYNRNNFNTYQSQLGNSVSTTAGLSLMYTTSFNSLRELFAPKKKKPEDEEININNDDLLKEDEVTPKNEQDP